MAKPQMPTPTPVQRPVAPAVVAKDVVVERIGSNEYRVTERTFDVKPTSTKVLQPNVTRVAAVAEVKIWRAERDGPDGYANAGLETGSWWAWWLSLRYVPRRSSRGGGTSNM